MFHDGSDDAHHLVANPQEVHPIPLALVHHLHQHFLECRRLCLFLRTEFAGCHDQYCEHDTPRLRHRQFLIWRSHFPREEPQGKVHRPSLGIIRYVVLVLRVKVKYIICQASHLEELNDLLGLVKCHR